MVGVVVVGDAPGVGHTFLPITRIFTENLLDLDLCHRYH